MRDPNRTSCRGLVLPFGIPGWQALPLLALPVLAMLVLVLAGGPQAMAGNPRLEPWPHLVEAPAAKPLADWLNTGDARAMPVRPEQGTRVLQSPPAFLWPAFLRPAVGTEADAGEGSRPGYAFRLILPDGQAVEHEAESNHLLLDRVLPPGSYAWQVRPAGDAGPGWSRPRRFEVMAGAAPFPVPDTATLWRRAREASRPLLFPGGEAWQAQRDDLLRGGRAALFARLHAASAAEAGRAVFVPEREPPAEPEADSGAEFRPGLWPSPTEQPYRDELAALEHAALVWHIAGDEAALAQARRRLAGILRWPKDGPTAFTRNDQLALRLLWSLAIAYDLLHDKLAPAERDALLASVSARAAPAFRWHFRNPEAEVLNYRAAPFDSHGYLHLANFAALAVIFADSLPEARDWFHAAVPLFLALVHPWGDGDGGSGNGANYAFYYLMDLLPRWDVLRNGIGVDPAHSAWARHFPVYATYFIPPGMPFVFGDGAGHADIALKATVARGLAARTGDRVARRYSAGLPQSFAVPPLAELTAPTRAPDLQGGPDHGRLPDAAVLPSIGWAALHSRLRAAGRNSVYFRSGPFGSESHNHADQNSFTVDVDGQRVVIASGYYDSYGSRHRREWTRQTRAHNAITFDGGQGQMVPRQDADGRITAFSDDGRLAAVAGDATAAHGGALTRAVRTLALYRPDILLVYDRLESDTPRRFEWNLHSPVEMHAAEGAGLRRDDGLLCVEMLAPDRLDLLRIEPFGGSQNAPERDDLPIQFHARFALPKPARRAEFLAVLRLRCAAEPVTILARRTGGGFDLFLDGEGIAIDARGAQRLPPDPE